MTLGEPLEQQSPRREQLAAMNQRAAVIESQQAAQRSPDARVSLGVAGEHVVQQRVELRPLDVPRILERDPGPHPDHVAERPEADPLPEARSLPAMPEHGRCQTVDILLELPAKTGLAEPGLSDDRDERQSGARFEHAVERSPEDVEFRGPPHEGKFELRPLGTADGGHDPHRAPRLNRDRLALDQMGPGVLVDDRTLGRQPGDVVDQHGARLRDRLKPRRRVHRVSLNHSLVDGGYVHRGLAGQNADPEPEVETEPVPEAGYGGHQIERGPHRPLGIVLPRYRRAPGGHHAVALVLADRAAVRGGDPAGGGVVRAHELANILRIVALAEGREAGEIAEQNRDQAALDRRQIEHGRPAGRPRAVRARALRALAISGGRPRAATAGIAAPHSRQNRWSGWLVSVPHAGQWSACGVPHWPQNFAPAGTSAAQLWHVWLIAGR